jgi:DNA (cytosine-5)-methyltransferase 1
MADGIPGRVDRLKALGNSIVPQIAELIGRAIMEAENDRGRAICHADTARTL